MGGHNAVSSSTRRRRRRASRSRHQNGRRQHEQAPADRVTDHGHSDVVPDSNCPTRRGPSASSAICWPPAGDFVLLPGDDLRVHKESCHFRDLKKNSSRPEAAGRHQRRHGRKAERIFRQVQLRFPCCRTLTAQWPRSSGQAWRRPRPVKRNTFVIDTEPQGHRRDQSELSMQKHADRASSPAPAFDRLSLLSAPASPGRGARRCT